MAYTTRLQHALEVYRQAWEAQARTASKVCHSRNYQLRRARVQPAPVATCYDEDDSDDLYDPSSDKKRRSTKSSKQRHAKAETDPDGVKPGKISPANPLHTTSDQAVSPSLITLKFRTDAGKALLYNLADEHGSGYTKKSAKRNESKNIGSQGQSRPSKTFLEKQDEESRKVGDKTLRSGFERHTDGNDTKPGCVRCRDNNKRCTSKTTGHFPCKRCHDEHLECVEGKLGKTTPSEKVAKSETANLNGLTFVSSSIVHPTTLSNPPTTIQRLRAAYTDAQAMRSPAGASRSNPIVLDSPRSTPEPEPLIFTISTAFAFPIDFKSVRELCHFCSDWRFGIFGYFPLRVQVFKVPGGEGLEEAGNGHRSRGQEATRMCVNCALRRLHISRCRKHTMVRFEVPKSKFQSYMELLLDSRYPNCPPSMQGPLWSCSLCSLPASFRCASNQTTNQYLQPMKNGVGVGCSLLLCDSCTNNVKADGGLLKRTAVRKGHDIPSCQRADMEFLFPKSLLHKALHKAYFQ